MPLKPTTTISSASQASPQVSCAGSGVATHSGRRADIMEASADGSRLPAEERSAGELVEQLSGQVCVLVRHAAEADMLARVGQPDAAVGTPGTAAPSGSGAAAPDDAQELRHEIERTREQLGQMVGQLAATADVRGRARDKAAKLSARLRTQAGQARAQTAAGAGSLRSQLAARTVTARQRALSAGGGGNEQLRRRSAAVGTPVREATPEQLRRTVAKGPAAPGSVASPLAVAAAAVIAGYLAGKWWRRR
jgi:Protein of unknown function (DUF3618)